MGGHEKRNNELVVDVDVVSSDDVRQQQSRDETSIFSLENGENPNFKCLVILLLPRLFLLSPWNEFVVLAKQYFK